MLESLIRFFLRNKYIILTVFLVAALRFVYPNIPPSLNWDEISHGYNAYSILKTGRDEWGNFLPSIFRAYGDYKLPVYIYLTSVSEFFFGLTTFAVRLPSIFAGIGIVIFTYLLVKELIKKSGYKFNREFVALFSAFLVGVEPWSFFLSRAAFEANLALFFFVMAMFFFFKFVNSQTTYSLLFTTFSLGLTVWTYNSYRVFTPLMMVALAFIYKKQLVAYLAENRKATTYVSLILIVFFLPMLFQLLTSVGQARYSWVEILDEGMLARINEARGLGGNRLLHNKVTYFFVGFSRNYISHFSPVFLFIRGGSNYQFSVPDSGILYLIGLPFLIFGLFFSMRQILDGKKVFFVLLLWLLLAPVPSALTREAPHVLRSITILPLPMVLTALGLYSTVRLSGRDNSLNRIIYLIFFLILAGQIGCYLKSYFFKYPVKYSQAWQFGYKEVSSYVKSHFSSSDKIVITKKYGEPHEFMLFYLGWDPQLYLNDSNLNRFHQSNWYWVDSFSKLFFVNDWQIKQEDLGKYVFRQESGALVDCSPDVFKCLLVTSPGNVPGDWLNVETIKFLDGSPAFEIYENKRV